MPTNLSEINWLAFAGFVLFFSFYIFILLFPTFRGKSRHLVSGLIVPIAFSFGALIGGGILGIIFGFLFAVILLIVIMWVFLVKRMVADQRDWDLEKQFKSERK